MCTLNVRTLNDLGGKELLDVELRKFSIWIAGLQEVPWPSSRELRVGDTTYLWWARRITKGPRVWRLPWPCGGLVLGELDTHQRAPAHCQIPTLKRALHRYRIHASTEGAD